MDENTEFEFDMSSDIAELSAALCKAQGAMEGASKSSDNPFFKSKYADLSAVWDDVRKPFADNGLSVVQMPCGGIGSVTLVTQITHTSGQWMRSRMTMVPVKNDPQGIGSCITYARRYSLAAMAGVYQVDDDGNKASATGEQISPDPIDMQKVKDKAMEAMHMVDADSEDYSKGAATSILHSLTSDERIQLQVILKAAKPEGTKKTYMSCFKDHLAMEKQAKKDAELNEPPF